MAELREFQRAAVDRIVVMLQSNCSGRFLLADEVGLGKTLIAQGVVDRLSQGRRHFTVVYLCSNLEIAAQNAEKLAPSDSAAKPIKDRLTLMTLGISPGSRSGLRIFSFTPGTSLELGRSTGIKRERRLLLYLVSQGLGKTLTAKWRKFFKCNPTISDWDDTTSLSVLKAEFGNTVHLKFQNRWASLVRQWSVNLYSEDMTSVPYRLVKALDSCVDDYNQYSGSWIGKNRNIVVGELRKALAVASLDYLDPDLVIMDEFQRFKQVLTHSREPDSLEAKLLANPKAKVLILSATPYKMYTKNNDDEDHHSGFLETYAFLSNCSIDDTRVDDLRKNLFAFRQGLEEIEPEKSVDVNLLDQKRKIESALHRVMCRTERNRYIDDACTGITEIPVGGENTTGVLPKLDELRQYVQLSKFLLRDPKRAHEYGRKIMDYWKSGPSLLSFMDGYYALIKTLRENNEVIPRHLLLNAKTELRQSHRYNQKFRQLFEKVFSHGKDVENGAGTDDWPFLWMKPSHTYYEDTFYRGRPAPQKFLVFSHWHFVPKTIAYLTSSELEKRLQFKKRDFKSSPLAFKKGLQSVFNVAMPSLALAAEVDAVGIAAGLGSSPNQRSVERAVRKQLLNAMQQPESGIEYTREGSSSHLWQIIARLEGLWCDRQGVEIGDQLYGVISDKNLGPASKDSSSNKWFRKYQLRYADWLYDSYANAEFSPIQINERSLRRIVYIALYSPAISILRSLLNTSTAILTKNRRSGEQENCVDLMAYVAKVGCGQLRNYFNRPLVQAIVNRFGRGTRYADKVLHYCGAAHLQAVLDEYIYLRIGNVNGDETKSVAERLIDQIGTVFSMHSGSPRINNRVNGRLETDSTTTGSAHFALAFGDDAQVESDGSGDYVSRKSDVRTAFNSPFWPFVLATTSVGQEGLDFHLYCKDIVHWNLPTNPVDLEQREGRLNRYNSFAIREMIARDYPLENADGFKRLTREHPDYQNGSERGLPWQWIFDAIESEPMSEQSFKQGLYPHWIYVPRNGKFEILRRHLLFYSKSKDSLRYKRLKRDLAIYRLVFGQPRQEDIVRKIRERLGDEVDEQLLHEFLPIYMINLSPFTEESIWKFAEEKSVRILANVREQERLVQLVSEMQSKRAELLAPIQLEIDTLVSCVRRHEPRTSPCLKTVASAAALYYLANPYDATYDFLRGIGLRDDLEVIKRVYTEHFSPEHEHQETNGIHRLQ